MRPFSKKSYPRRQPSIRIGTSGWSYAHWRHIFYPEGLPSARWLGFYVRHFGTVEINNSFYKLPEAKTLLKWRREASSDFVFAVKANRFITHMKKLKNVEEALATLLERVGSLGRNLGPILFQLPPNINFDAGRLRDFLDILPPQRRYVIEFRNATWLNDRAIELLRARRAAFCIHDLFEDACPQHVTSSFSYFRFHGFGEKYGGSYPKRTLTAHAETMADMVARGKDVYAYFNNDAHGYALKDAVRLRRLTAAIFGAQM